MERIAVTGVVTAHEIPEEWANDKELFDYWWMPETQLIDGIWTVTRPARLSDEAKMEHCRMKAENLVTNLGIALLLVNMSVVGQGNMEPFFQILSVGNGAITGVTRATTSVSGDGFATNSRKAPTSDSQAGFVSTVVTNFASGDAVGTWTNLGIYSYSIAGSQNATTTAGTGALATAALFNFVKGASAYALNYALTLSN